MRRRLRRLRPDWGRPTTRTATSTTPGRRGTWTGCSARKVDGLFRTGSYGAGPLMSVEERIHVFELAKQCANKFIGKTLLPHVGCIDTANAVELAKAVYATGADAIGAVPPFYYKQRRSRHRLPRRSSTPSRSWCSPTTTPRPRATRSTSRRSRRRGGRLFQAVRRTAPCRSA